MVQKFIGKWWLLVILGVGSTITDSLTSFPYLGAIGAIKSHGYNAFVSTIYLFMYCLIFLVPSFAIIIEYCFYKSKFVVISDWVNKALEKVAPLIMKYGLIAIGLWLVYIGARYFAG